MVRLRQSNSGLDGGSTILGRVKWGYWMDAGIIGGLLGSVLGIAGGAVGTYFSIKNTNGPLERAFMVKAAVITWIAVSLFLVLLFIIPQPYNYLAWIPYGLLLPVGIYKMNATQAKLRDRDSNDKIERSTFQQ